MTKIYSLSAIPEHLRGYFKSAPEARQEIGQEQSPAEYVAAMVAVMREVRRVLADDGTLWLNVGDSYASDTKGSGGKNAAKSTLGVASSGERRMDDRGRARAFDRQSFASRRFNHGAKPKDLLGIPWRLALALQDDGWFLRSDIVWAKPNPMPESVTDRPTRAHEYVFLLTKRPRYFYDADAIRERASSDFGRGATGRGSQGSALAVGCNGRQPQQDHSGWMGGDGETRNARDVWTITPEPFAEAHFATMPPELARRCILAGSRKGDVVLDPFGGAATTALVAMQHGRRALLCELNPEYVEIQRRRLADFEADTTSAVKVAATDFGPLFGGAR